MLEANRPKNQAYEAILISDNIDAQPKLTRRGREGYYSLRREMQQENNTVLNIFAQNTGHRSLSNTTTA